MKQCKKYRQWIWPAVYDELKEREKKLLDEHIEGCADCLLDFEEAKQTKNLLDKKIQLKPTASLMEESRTELHQRLLLATQPGYKTKWIKKMWQFISLDFSPALRFSTVLAMLLIGILIGKWMFINKVSEKDFNEQQFSLLSNLNIAGVESINYDPMTHQVSMKLNTMKQLTIQGDMDTPEIKHLLAQTLMTEERPNIRLKTVGALSMTKSFDQQVIKALIEVLENDENPGIRLKAIKLLTTIPFNGSIKNLITKVLIRVLLKEDNSAIRNEAIDGLNKFKNGSIEPIIYNAARNNSSEYVRSKAALILQRIENPEVPEQ